METKLNPKLGKQLKVCKTTISNLVIRWVWMDAIAIMIIGMFEYNASQWNYKVSNSEGN